MVDNTMTAPRQSRMHSKNFGQEEFKFRTWSAVLEETQTLEDALNPRFWIDQASQLMGFDKTNVMGRGDTIIVRKHDMTERWVLQVVEIGTGFIKAVLIAEGGLKDPVLPEASPLEWKWNAGRKAYDVIRKDGFVLSSGHQTKDAAKAWIMDHTKAMAA